MKTKVLVGVLLFLIAINLATIGTFVYLNLTRPPQPPEFMEPPSRSGEGPRAPRGLDKGQREQLVALMNEFRDETRALRDSVRDLERSALELLKQDKLSLEQVDARLADIAALRLKLSEAAARKLIKAKAFLNPEQQEQFINLIIHSQPRRPDGPPFHAPPGEHRFPPPEEGMNR